MTRIDFYILESNTPQAREKFACRLIDKAQRNGHSVFVQSQVVLQTELLNDLLWSFKPESFIPHALLDSKEAKDCSVLLGNDITTVENRTNDVLVNFDHTVPDSFSQYSRVVEIVNKQDNSTVDGRTRYTYYKDRGYKMESHNLRG